MQVKSYQLRDHCRSAQASEVKSLLAFGVNHGLARSCCDEWAMHQLSLPSRDALQEVTSDPMRFASCRAAEVEDLASWLEMESAMPSLMGDARLVMINAAHDADSATAQAIRKALPHMLHPVIVKADALAPRSPLRQLFEKDKKNLIAIGCYEDSPRTLADLLREQAAQQGKTIHPDALNQLLAHKSDNRDDLLGFLNMVMLYAHDTIELSESDVMACLSVHHGVPSSLERLPHAIMLGQWKDVRVHHVAHDDHIQLVRLVLYHLRRLQDGYHLMADGMSLEEAMASLKPPVFFKQKAAFRRTWQLWNNDTLTAVMTEWLALEEQLKSHSSSWGHIVLHHLLLKTSWQAKRFRQSRSAKSY